MAVPRVLSVKFLTPWTVKTWKFMLFGLRDNKVKQRVINAFGKEFITSLLHVSGASRELWWATRERF